MSRRAVLAAGLLGVTGAAGGAAQERPVACATAPVSIRVGQVVEVRATSSSGIPYRWVLRDSGTVLERTAAVSPAAATRDPSERPVPGGPVGYVWAWRGVRPGTQELRAELVSFTNEATVAQSVGCRVTVDEGAEEVALPTADHRRPAVCADGRSLVVAVGQTVHLPVTASAGIPYRWVVRTPEVLDSLGIASRSAANRPGGPVSTTYSFRGAREGPGDLRADLMSINPRDTSAARSVRCRVTVRVRE